MASPGLAFQAPVRLAIGQPAPSFTRIPGADGRRHSLADWRGRAVILEWTSPVCPYTAGQYDRGAMQALQARAKAMGVVWVSVNTAARGRAGYLKAAAARARLARLNARPDAFLIDEKTVVGRAYGARTTPSFFIIGRDGRLMYQGAIDDDARAEGKPTRNYVSEALDAIAAGRAPRDAETKPYGCAVEY